MNPLIQATDAIGGIAGRESSTALAAPDGAGDFSRWISHEMNAMNAQMVGAEAGVQQLAAGGTGQLHEVMLRLEEARLQFQLAIQVRSHVVEAFQDIIRMQV